MTEEVHLFESFAGKSLRRGNEFYFDRSTALEFIQACEDAAIAVIGVECFWLTPQATVPEPTLIADYSSNSELTDAVSFRERNNRQARHFVRTAPNGVFFNFVVGNPPRHRGPARDDEDRQP